MLNWTGIAETSTEFFTLRTIFHIESKRYQVILRLITSSLLRITTTHSSFCSLSNIAHFEAELAWGAFPSSISKSLLNASDSNLTLDMAQATGQGVPVSSSAPVVTFEAQSMSKSQYMSQWVVATWLSWHPFQSFFFLPMLNCNGLTTSSSCWLQQLAQMWFLWFLHTTSAYIKTNLESNAGLYADLRYSPRTSAFPIKIVRIEDRTCNDSSPLDLAHRSQQI